MSDDASEVPIQQRIRLVFPAEYRYPKDRAKALAGEFLRAGETERNNYEYVKAFMATAMRAGADESVSDLKTKVKEQKLENLRLLADLAYERRSWRRKFLDWFKSL